MSHRERKRKPARNAPSLDPRPRILIVCEGANTEPQYLNGLRSHFKNPRVQIETQGGKGVPKTLVSVAKKWRDEAIAKSFREDDENLLYEQVWCVFDIDEHPEISNAIAMARDNHIQLAISNPCIELWLLLHFRDHPGAQHRHKMKELLEEFVPGYDKKIEIAKFIDGYPDAVRRAERLARAIDDLPEWKRNPSSGLFRLTRVMAEEATPIDSEAT